MNKSFKLLVILSFLMFGCRNKKHSPVVFNHNISKKTLLNNEQLKTWLFKDMERDTIPGISLDRTYSDLIMNKKGQEVIVAVIDTEIEIEHEDLSGFFWKNKNEIPNNNIDDDKNGYVDDIEGWNFIGNKKGDNIYYANKECVRILQKFQKQFKEIDNFQNVREKDTADYKLYRKAKNYYQNVFDNAKSELEQADYLEKNYSKSWATVEKIYPNGNYTTKELDSLVQLYLNTNFELAKQIYYVSDCIKYDIDEEWIAKLKKRTTNSLNYTLNLDYFDRDKIDSFPEDITKTAYGNNSISNTGHNDYSFYHGTYISGIITANRTNNIGAKGILNNVKIIPLAIAASGNGEHDKDIALAIRYAVDNGAKVINMSFSKRFSLNKGWIFDALKYAEKNDVILICGPGNDAINLDINNDIYPNDNVNNGKEVANNFMLIGAVSHLLDSTFVSEFSNYGSIDVDVFAPGENIYTTNTKNRYDFSDGTSGSCAVASGVAALIRSYYPKLKAWQVKQILMESGIKYDMEVFVPGTDNKKANFTELSKSGRVINAYNAFIMAENMVK